VLLAELITSCATLKLYVQFLARVVLCSYMHEPLISARDKKDTIQNDRSAFGGVYD